MDTGCGLKQNVLALVVWLFSCVGMRRLSYARRQYLERSHPRNLKLDVADPGVDIGTQGLLCLSINHTSCLMAFDMAFSTSTRA